MPFMPLDFPGDEVTLYGVNYTISYDCWLQILYILFYKEL